MVTPRVKSRLPEAQRRVELAMLHNAVRQVQHTINWAVVALISYQHASNAIIIIIIISLCGHPSHVQIGTAYLVGLVVKASASRAGGPGFESR